MLSKDSSSFRAASRFTEKWHHSTLLPSFQSPSGGVRGVHLVPAPLPLEKHSAFLPFCVCYGRGGGWSTMLVVPGSRWRRDSKLFCVFEGEQQSPAGCIPSYVVVLPHRLLLGPTEQGAASTLQRNRMWRRCACVHRVGWFTGRARREGILYAAGWQRQGIASPDAC